MCALRYTWPMLESCRQGVGVSDVTLIRFGLSFGLGILFYGFCVGVYKGFTSCDKGFCGCSSSWNRGFPAFVKDGHECTRP